MRNVGAPQVRLAVAVGSLPDVNKRDEGAAVALSCPASQALAITRSRPWHAPSRRKTTAADSLLHWLIFTSWLLSDSQVGPIALLSTSRWLLR